MIISSPKRPVCRGFTLVEMLVVVAIIGVIAGLVTVAAAAAMRATKRAVIVAEFKQIDLALAAYKEKYGEYPPDGTDTRDLNNNGIPDSFERHFQRVFPKANLINELALLAQNNQFPCGNMGQLQTFFQNYTPSTALAFWLGGMQEDDYSLTSPNKNPKSRFVGFSTNPMRPLSDNGASRLPMWFEFDTTRITDPAGAAMSTTIFRKYQGNVNVPLPYVYFRAELKQKGAARGSLHGKEEYLMPNLRTVKFIQMNNPTDTQIANAVKPYYDVTQQSWVNPTSYQLLFCGFDQTFGKGNLYKTGRWDASKWTGPVPQNIFFDYYTGPESSTIMDDITNFSEGGTISDRIP